MAKYFASAIDKPGLKPYEIAQSSVGRFSKIDVSGSRYVSQSMPFRGLRRIVPRVDICEAKTLGTEYINRTLFK